MNIIELAREAGFHKWYTQPKEHPDHVAIVARFAALVRASALEEAAQECENQKVGFPSYFEIDERIAGCANAIRALAKEKP
jgi:hypothetical protein